MFSYDYYALDSKGQAVSGRVDATDRNAASSALRRSGLYPTSLSQVGSNAPGSLLDKAERAFVDAQITSTESRARTLRELMASRLGVAGPIPIRVIETRVVCCYETMVFSLEHGQLAILTKLGIYFPFVTLAELHKLVADHGIGKLLEDLRAPDVTYRWWDLLRMFPCRS